MGQQSIIRVENILFEKNDDDNRKDDENRTDDEHATDDENTKDDENTDEESDVDEGAPKSLQEITKSVSFRIMGKVVIDSREMIEIEM